MSTEQRFAEAKPAEQAGLWGTAALALFKGIVGGLAGSKSLLADAFRTAAECAAAFALSSAKQSGNKKAGTMRTEALTNVFLAVFFLITSLEIGISAIRSISEGVDEPPHWSALAAILACLVARELFFSRKERGSSLYCSLAALVGAGGAMLGKAAALPALYYLDPAAAIVIAVIVMLSGYRTITGFVRKDSKEESKAEDTEVLMQLIQRVEGVITVESIQAKEQGHYVVADIVISVNPRISVLEGHEIAKRVKQLLLTRFGHVTDVTIHVEPYDPGYPYKSNHDPNQEHMPTLLQ
ncbi:cation diffusion facilitator family transporter [Paenibacillus glycanilyticus]|uniref:cation diffusion facilitator family transporter n=1 Tax=Paenibacillus glycanilyticus TaxID=126569 RepID=UPI00203C2048|nr:cation diffusion facilitator family transporter [Paenibacillus glycanilyticus]MCM3630122.1 cation diffusion facilitator family transporter [Paenibacillus glycanilyticus]